jgi:hypothetical protein
MTNKPEYLDELIEKASKAAGNDSRLAVALGVNRQAVSNWRKGLKTCPVADQAIMANLAGLDAEAWLARATIESYAAGPKREVLKETLKKACRATGVGAAMCGLLVALLAWSPQPVEAATSYDVYYVKLHCYG